MYYNTDLSNGLFECVSESLKGKDNAVIGISFSGGIDSTLLAVICRFLGFRTLLLTVGFANAHDNIFSKKISSKLNMDQKILEIKQEDFSHTSRVITEMITCNNTSHIENCIAFHYVSRLASENGIDTVLTANGCDELFCGYNIFRLIFNHGPEAIEKTIHDKIIMEYELMNEINQISNKFGVTIEQPFLSKKFINYAMVIPIDKKIDNSEDFLRKHILRKIALSLDIPPETVIRKKRAFQYGSLIHKNYKQS